MDIAHFRIEKGKKIIYQSVEAHLNGTANLAEGFASKINMPKAGRLLGLLHDSGKFGAYQQYLQECIQYELGNRKAPPVKGSVDHGVFGAVYIMELTENERDAFSQVMAEILAMAIAYHHGGLRDYLGLDTSTPLWDRIRNYQQENGEEFCLIKTAYEKIYPADEIRNLFSAAVRELKNLKEALSNLSNFHLHLVVKFLYSCLIDADREDTRIFMEGIENKEKNSDWEKYGNHLEAHLDDLHNRRLKTDSEKKIRDLREEMSEACYQAGDWPTGVYKLTVPTGGGKTLASMRMALRHIRKKRGADTGHIIQVLPFTAIIEQNADAVRNILECKEDLLEHHSNIVLETGDEMESNLSKERYRLLTERWESMFIFTTTVQFLDTVYASGTQNIRRMHNLANSVIIMDEVQALPLKTMKLFGELIDFLCRACDTTILLCTATQPNLEELPIGIKTKVREIVPDITRKFAQFERMTVLDKTREEGYTVEEAAALIAEVKKTVKSLLVVMNTKKIVKQTYEILKKDMESRTEILYITTELCPAHRRAVILHLKELLEQKKPVICVSTSLLEAGVDVSFEGVVRSLAGLDSIAQSSGRGNRNGESSHKGIAYIINIKNEKLGSMIEIVAGKEKTESVLDTYRRKPEAYHNSLLSPEAMADYYRKYFDAEAIKKQLRYPLEDDPEMKNMYMYFTNDGDKVLKRRYTNKNGKYGHTLTYPFETAGKKFHVIDQNTVSILVPYGEGKKLITDFIEREGRYGLDEMRSFMKAARPYFVNIYTDKLKVYQEAVVSSPIPGVLILRDGYYDDVTGIKEEQTLKFLSY